LFANTTSTTTTTTTINLDNFACVPEVGGTFQFFDFITINGITRPRYFPTFISPQPSLQIVIYASGGGAVWAIYAPEDDVNYNFGNTNPAPAYPWLETSWQLGPVLITRGPC
jgi:hypothetical protein